MAEIYSSSGNKLRLMVTWVGVEGETRPEPKTWHGVSFEQGKPTPVEHLPDLARQSMIADIDRGRGEWTYEYVVPPPEPEPEPEPDPEPDPEGGGTTYTARKPASSSTRAQKARKPARRRR